ncbi:hypothetical protein HYT91_00985 [Candidatus Pacearchaeota archaeon]|nr:hypothetical protein [Candidatus Pacearchaeota archaeon]
MSAGNSNYKVRLADTQPGPDIQISTPSSWMMATKQGAFPNSPSSFSYINSNGEALGGITKLNNSEMLFLLDKHFGG